MHWRRPAYWRLFVHPTEGRFSADGVTDAIDEASLRVDARERFLGDFMPGLAHLEAPAADGP